MFEWLTLVCDPERRDPSAESHRLLFEYRDDFRAIVRLRPIRGLVACLGSSNRDLRRLAIYLLGRSSQGATVNAVKLLRDDPDSKVRRAAARALERMSEWTELQSMAKYDDDPRVRYSASKRSNTVRRAYSERLQQFAQHGSGRVCQSGQFTSHMPVFMVEPIGPGKPAKTGVWIRRILEHIRQLVRYVGKNRAV